jgi:hypothetical protein
MNIQLPTHVDKPAFLGWLTGVEERFELVGGRAVMMVRASRGAWDYCSKSGIAAPRPT